MVFDVRADDPPSPQQTSGPTLSLIVVNHRRPDLLSDAIRALHASRRRPDEVVVVEVEGRPPCR